MIAIDVMGGDNAPDVVLRAAVLAAEQAIPLVLFGPEAMIKDWLDSNCPQWNSYPISIVGITQVVSMEDEPVSAVRKKQDSSLVCAVASVARGQTKAIVSAGNSGALMAAAIFLIGRDDGVERPAIAGFVPVFGGRVLVLDLGANTECRPVHLYQFAHMADSYIRKELCIDKPRIGLLANGHENTKGSILVKQVHAMLQESTLNFIGNVEPVDVFNYKIDILVTDGFSGNIFLKTVEACVGHMLNLVAHEEKERLFNTFFSTAATGATLLGIKGSVIICHGGASVHDLERAISAAWNAVKKDCA